MRHFRPKTLLVLGGSAIWLAGLGWIDRATGYELGLFAFYTAPVAVVAWNLGKGPGIIVAFIASVIWYVADRYAGDHYSSPFYGYWNTGMHLTSFVINALAFAKIKSGLDQRDTVERALHESHEHMRQLVGLLRVCSRCHQLYVPEPLAARMESCLEHATSHALSHGSTIATVPPRSEAYHLRDKPLLPRQSTFPCQFS